MDITILKYIKSFENISYKSLNNILECVDNNVFFSDPFNHFVGKKKFEKLLHEMLRKIENPKFEVKYICKNKNIFVLKWVFNGKVKKYFSFEGVTELEIKKKLIIKHIDYWDSGKNFYCKIPVIGNLFRKIHF